MPGTNKIMKPKDNVYMAKVFSIMDLKKKFFSTHCHIYVACTYVYLMYHTILFTEHWCCRSSLLARAILGGLPLPSQHHNFAKAFTLN